MALQVDRTGDMIYLLQALAGVKQPQRIPLLPRPGNNRHAAPQELAEPPKMSSKAEVRAFFGGDATKVVVSGA